MDKMGADPAGRSLSGGGGGPRRDAAKAMGAVFAAAATDPVIGRGIARFMNLLTTAGGADGRPASSWPASPRSWRTRTPTRSRPARVRPAPSCSSPRRTSAA